MKNKVFFGEGCFTKIRDILKDSHFKRVFIISGKNILHISGINPQLENYLESHTFEVFNEFTHNPKIDDIEKGIECYNNFSPDIVLSIGGGTAIDMAKSINVLSRQQGKIADIIKGIKNIREKGKPLIAVPTTSGTGSEATNFAVVYINSKKYSLEHDFLLPDYAIVDPFLTKSLPPEVAATTGMDAISQSIESFWSVNSTNQSKAYAAEALGLLIPAIKKAVHNPTDKIRLQMSNGAHLAGKAINISKTTAPHALSYGLTIDYNIPHGHAVCIFLKKFLKINSLFEMHEINDPRGKEYLRSMMNQLYDLLGASNAKEGGIILESIMNSIGLETDLKLMGIKNNTEKEKLIKGVNIQRLQNNPIKISESMLMEVFDIS
jgi:alcohol dehydrogenase